MSATAEWQRGSVADRKARDRDGGSGCVVVQTPLCRVRGMPWVHSATMRAGPAPDLVGAVDAAEHTVLIVSDAEARTFRVFRVLICGKGVRRKVSREQGVLAREMENSFPWVWFPLC